MFYEKYIPQLSVLYQEPHRTYHSLQHIQFLIREIYNENYKSLLLPGVRLNSFGVRELQEFLCMLAWFHDAYYDPYLGSPMNEYISAELFKSMVPNYMNDGVTSHVYNGIILTGEHAFYHGAYDPELNCVCTVKSSPTILEQFLFMDLDMFGFYDEDVCRRNNKLVRAEYPNTTDTDYNSGRDKFLQSLLDKPRIMYLMNDEVEQTVRVNIQRSIDDPFF